MRKGQKMSEQSKQKLRDSKKGKSNGRLGTKHTEETKKKLKKVMLKRVDKGVHFIPDNTGMKHTQAFKDNVRANNLKRFQDKENHPMFGYKFSDESKLKMKESHLGHNPSEETRKKLSKLHKGDKHWNWQGGITPFKQRLRVSREWKKWRKEVFERDDYTCQECLKKGCYLEPHHIIPIRSDCNTLFTLTNGISLCRPCHQKTIWKEHLFEERYFLLTSSK